MPVAGRKPKPEGQKRNRAPLTHQFVDVPDVAFVGGPELPAKNPDWRAETKQWWTSVVRMPHCVLWTETDWQFAFDSALVYEEFLSEPIKAAPAKLNCDKQLGTTMDFRRDLRIRYVPPDSEKSGEDASITALAEYRALLESG